MSYNDHPDIQPDRCMTTRENVYTSTPWQRCLGEPSPRHNERRPPLHANIRAHCPCAIPASARTNPMLGTTLAGGACKRRAFARPRGCNFARPHGSWQKCIDLSGACSGSTFLLPGRREINLSLPLVVTFRSAKSTSGFWLQKPQRKCSAREPRMVLAALVPSRGRAAGTSHGRMVAEKKTSSRARTGSVTIAADGAGSNRAVARPCG